MDVLYNIYNVLKACLLVVLYNMSVASVRVVEYGTYAPATLRWVEAEASILGDYTLSLDTLNGIHWMVLLRFAKASKRFLRP